MTRLFTRAAHAAAAGLFLIASACAPAAAPPPTSAPAPTTAPAAPTTAAKPTAAAAQATTAPKPAATAQPAAAPTPAAPASAATAIKRGGLATIAFCCDANHLDPHRGTTAQNYVSLVYDGLTQLSTG